MSLIIFLVLCVIITIVVDYLIDVTTYETIKLYFLYLPSAFIFLNLFIQLIAPKEYYELNEMTGKKSIRNNAPIWFRAMALFAIVYCVSSLVGFFIGVVSNLGYEALRR